MLFSHTPDDLIVLDGFLCTLAEFQAQRPGYALPGGTVCRQYDGARHALYDAAGNQRGGPLPWPEGDGYLAAAAALRAAVEAARRAANPPPARRPRALAALKADIQALPAAQRQQLRDAVQLEQAAEFLARHPRFAEALGINLPGDEPAN